MAKNEEQDQTIIDEQTAEYADGRIAELTADMQRQRADFENYRKRVELEKDAIRESSKAATIVKLLPVIDNIDRAVAHMPEDLQDNNWAQGIAGLTKQLDKVVKDFGLERIDATAGAVFDPHYHEAVMFDETAEGDQEVIAEELQTGYILNGDVVRPSMVKVTKR